MIYSMSPYCTFIKFLFGWPKQQFRFTSIKYENILKPLPVRKESRRACYYVPEETEHAPEETELKNDASEETKHAPEETERKTMLRKHKAQANILRKRRSASRTIFRKNRSASSLPEAQAEPFFGRIEALRLFRSASNTILRKNRSMLRKRRSMQYSFD